MYVKWWHSTEASAPLVLRYSLFLLLQVFGSYTVDSSNLPVALASSPVQATSLDDRVSGLTSSTPVWIRSKEERSLSAKLQQLFESADSITAQESLLVCLRCVPIA